MWVGLWLTVSQHFFGLHSCAYLGLLLFCLVMNIIKHRWNHWRHRKWHKSGIRFRQNRRTNHKWCVSRDDYLCIYIYINIYYMYIWLYMWRLILYVNLFIYMHTKWARLKVCHNNFHFHKLTASNCVRKEEWQEGRSWSRVRIKWANPE